MKVSLVVAMDKQRGVGKNNDLPWHLPADMRFFKETTTGHVVVMGRKNYESIPERFRPLPNRENAVLTRNKDYQAPGCTVFHSLEECMENYKNETERTVFIIGGGEIFKQALDSGIVDEMYITHIDKSYECDVFFPDFDHSLWEKEQVFYHEMDEKNPANFEILKFSKI